MCHFFSVPNFFFTWFFCHNNCNIKKILLLTIFSIFWDDKFIKRKRKCKRKRWFTKTNNRPDSATVFHNLNFLFKLGPCFPRVFFVAFSIFLSHFELCRILKKFPWNRNATSECDKQNNVAKIYAVWVEYFKCVAFCTPRAG